MRIINYGKDDKKSYCKDIEWRVNQNTNHVVSIEEYPERSSDLTINGKNIQKHEQYKNL